MNSIVTFYSFKGGVGRSMALANIAALLAQKGKKVLAVDWDLEAPGLERYFSDYEQICANKAEDGVGLLDLLVQTQQAKSSAEWPDWRQFVTTIEIPKVGRLDMITAGRQDEGYAGKLDAFEWKLFFKAHDGGCFFETLRESWLAQYDVTLIDSRTGLTDAGGVCTILMPDVLVAVFTANNQSLYGVRDAIQMAQNARQKTEYDRMPLLVLPLPSRWDGRAEVEESRAWLQRFAQTMGHCYNAWLPSDYAPAQMLERTKVPHVAHFSFGEKLPAITHGVSDPELPGYAYAAHATLLAENFKHAEQLLGSPLPHSNALLPQKAQGDYRYDIYISRRRGSSVTLWLEKHFLSMFKGALELALGREPYIFFDSSEISGTSFPCDLESALLHSRCLLPFLTYPYFNSGWCLRELWTFIEREELCNKILMTPIVLDKRDAVPDYIQQGQITDMSQFFITASAFAKTEKFIEFELIVRELASNVANKIISAPKFSNDWKVLPENFSKKDIFI